MDFQKELSAKTAEIEKIIAKFLPAVEGPQKTVLEAMNYGMAAGGKRLRPMLMQETYRLFGGCDGVIEPFMAAIEMIHNYSLIHDDLPAMDNDEYRRGRKTTHAVYGETMGILAGDALLNYAFETAASAFNLELSERTAKALQLLSAKSGIYGMVGGQTVDIDFDAGTVCVDGIVLDEDYIREPTFLEEGLEFPVTLGENELFVLGDNRNGSTDSRVSSCGMIDERMILGRVLFRIFPLNKIGTVK